MIPEQDNRNLSREPTILGAKIAWGLTGDKKWRGVFALEDIKKGEVVEVSPAITVSAESVVENGEPPDGYLLQWDDETPGEEYCMPMGYIMMYNHSASPNLKLESDMEEYTITAIAKRDILAGEELTWDYNCEIWFEED